MPRDVQEPQSTATASEDLEPWVPAFPGQRRPFQPGNDVALTHGARSERCIAPLTESIAADLLSDASMPEYLRDDVSYHAAIYSYARAEAVVALLTQHITGLSIEKATKGAMPLLEQLRRWESTAMSHRRVLGLDPTARAKLQRELVSTAATARNAGITRLTDVGGALVDQARARGALTVVDVPKVEDEDGPWRD